MLSAHLGLIFLILFTLSVCSDRNIFVLFLKLNIIISYHGKVVIVICLMAKLFLLSINIIWRFFSTEILIRILLIFKFRWSGNFFAYFGHISFSRTFFRWKHFALLLLVRRRRFYLATCWIFLQRKWTNPTALGFFFIMKRSQRISWIRNRSTRWQLLQR